MIITIIAAIAKNGVIGKDNMLPWKLPADMQRFRKLTRGKPVIMGRKTFESIGKPLPERTNIVLTKDAGFHAPGCVVVHSTAAALKAAQGTEEVMVIGGSSVYEVFLPLADRMCLTWIDHDFEGDTYFPRFDPSEWREVSKETHSRDTLNPHEYTFVTLERIR